MNTCSRGGHYSLPEIKKQVDSEDCLSRGVYFESRHFKISLLLRRITSEIGEISEKLILYLCALPGVMTASDDILDTVM